MESLKRFVRDEDGVTMIEYALLAALIAVFLVAAITTTRGAIATLFGKITTALGAA